MMKLTTEQNKVLDFIMDRQKKAGSAPTVREIATHFGYNSTNSVRQHLRLIEQKGYIRRLPGRSRGIEVLVEQETELDAHTVSVPLVGSIAAGTPITALENIEGSISLDRDFFKSSNLFSLRVKGESMKDAGILDGDIAVIQSQATVNNGEIAAVIVDEEATLKRFFRESHRIVLKGENPSFEDIVIQSDKDVQIAGKLVGVMRRCKNN